MARTVYDEMLVGAADLHVHVDLEFSRTKFRKALPEWEWLPRAERAGMRAVLLKSHLWPRSPWPRCSSSSTAARCTSPRASRSTP